MNREYLSNHSIEHSLWKNQTIGCNHHHPKAASSCWAAKPSSVEALVVDKQEYHVQVQAVLQGKFLSTTRFTIWLSINRDNEVFNKAANAIAANSGVPAFSQMQSKKSLWVVYVKNALNS